MRTSYLQQRLLKVLILDMQPIDPPIGGGRLRLLGLYHGLGEDMPSKYIGTYDWPGEKHREHTLSDSLVEVDIPLSEDHFAAHDKWKKRLNGKTAIDSLFPQLAHLSPEYVETVQKELPNADIVFFSHPWIYPIAKDFLRPHDQLILYDAHNVEGFLRVMLLDDGNYGTQIARDVIRIEHELCHYSDLVLTCSHDDRELFHSMYGVPYKKMRVVPNGVFARKILPPKNRERRDAKSKIGLPNKKLAIFMGSLYDPNLDAARFICCELAPKMPELMFAICGGVCDGLYGASQITENKNVHLAGYLTDEQKILYLMASDIALNPMTSGSGTNIKMFDYFAAGLPTVSTSTGARGIEQNSTQSFIIASPEQFREVIRSIIGDALFRQELSQNCRKLVEEKYAWERISPRLGDLTARWYSDRSNEPFFSVIIPSYKRHDKLSILMDRLSKQRFTDFEVIVVDQSDVPWKDRNVDFGIDIHYIHSDIRGAVKARNTACFYAKGHVLAFTDDDCEPKEDWLYNARSYFSSTNLIGVEGLIKSARTNDPDYRTVSNEGFEGLGFMTANLFLRAEIFNAINGFDEQFDNPHFREDTDLAWRALEYGEIPFARDVEVFHPPHKRSLHRESRAERNKFFEKDILLLKKHPERYKQLFLAECHWQKSPDFCRIFLNSASEQSLKLPQWCRPYLEEGLHKRNLLEK